MSEPLDEALWQSLVSDVDAGSARVVVSRGLSRHFFTHVSNESIKSVTGQSYFGQKLAVIGCLTVGICAALFCLYVVAREFENLAFFAVPLVGILWTVIAGFTTEMGDGLKLTVPVFAVALLLSYLLPAPYALPLMLFVGSLFLYRTSHLLAQVFLTSLMTSSFEAWEMMEMHASIERNDT